MLVGLVTLIGQLRLHPLERKVSLRDFIFWFLLREVTKGQACMLNSVSHTSLEKATFLNKLVRSFSLSVLFVNLLKKTKIQTRIRAAIKKNDSFYLDFKLALILAMISP